MKNLKILMVFVFLPMVFSITSCKKTTITEEKNITNEQNLKMGPWPDVTWKLGISADLWKPKYNCERGVGICRINAVFVEFDWNSQVAPINFGISETNEIIIVFLGGINIIEHSGQNYISVEEGDELIGIDSEIVEYFNSFSIDLSNILLEQGVYEFQYDEESGNFFLIIPYYNL